MKNRILIPGGNYRLFAFAIITLLITNSCVVASTTPPQSTDQDKVTPTQNTRKKTQPLLKTAKSSPENAKLVIKVASVLPPKSADPLPANTQIDEERYTSLVIDATEFSVVTAISPKILTVNGEEVYGTIKVSPEWANEHGIISYPPTMEYALNKTERTGKRPLVIRAIGVRDNEVNLCISEEDAKRIRDANEKSHFLENCAVVVVAGARK